MCIGSRCGLEAATFSNSNLPSPLVERRALVSPRLILRSLALQQRPFYQPDTASANRTEAAPATLPASLTALLYAALIPRSVYLRSIV